MVRLCNETSYIVDWTGLPTTILDSQQMVTTMTYDALNRAMNVMYPNDVNGNRKILTPTYNKAGTVLSVDFDGTEYIKEIAYDAKGQPLLTAYGNDIMTRYAYDEDTFRVVRLKSEKYVYSNLANNPTYTPQAGSTKQDFAYEYDLVGNIMKLHDRTPDCGILGSVGGVDALDKLFDYDPLYRVISASGRESTNQNPNILWGTVAAVGSPNANNAQAYTQSFQYDKLGNMEKLKQIGNNAYTRNYKYDNYATNNKLSRIEGNGSPAPVYSNFAYDVNGNMTSSDLDRSYIWDAADQLRAFSIQAGTGEPSIYAQYLYSGGQRVKKIVRTTGGDYEVTVYDGAFEYMKKVSGGNTYEKNYTNVEGAATVRAGVKFPGDINDAVVYNLGDNIGSINVRLSTTGTLIDREEYYPFGDTSLRTFTYKRYRYVNKEKDSESGLYYYGARYYASWTCRFISVDPLAADFPFYCSYQYAGNKPINSTDINGMAESGSSGQGGGGDNITPKDGDTRVNKYGGNQIYLAGKWAGVVNEVEVTNTNYTPFKNTISNPLDNKNPNNPFFKQLNQDGGIANQDRENNLPLELKPRRSVENLFPDQTYEAYENDKIEGDNATMAKATPSHLPSEKPRPIVKYEDILAALNPPEIKRFDASAGLSISAGQNELSVKTDIEGNTSATYTRSSSNGSVSANTNGKATVLGLTLEEFGAKINIEGIALGYTSDSVEYEINLLLPIYNNDGGFLQPATIARQISYKAILKIESTTTTIFASTQTYKISITNDDGGDLILGGINFEFERTFLTLKHGASFKVGSAKVKAGVSGTISTDWKKK